MWYDTYCARFGRAGNKKRPRLKPAGGALLEGKEGPLWIVPLADRVRPQTIDEVVGQKHLLGPNAPAAPVH